MQGIERFTRAWHTKFEGYQDARHEAMAYVAEHPSVIVNATPWLIAMRLTQMLCKRSQRPEEDRQAVVIMTEVDSPVDALTAAPGTYTTEKVARLIAACFGEEDLKALHDPFADRIIPEVKRSVYNDPSRRNDDWAEYADVTRAYKLGGSNRAGLTDHEVRSLYCRYALDMTKHMVNMHDADYRVAERALTKVTNYMNGGHAE